MGYYSPFRGPEAISIVVEPQVALTCWSSPLAVLADSGPFLGLLFWVPEAISIVVEPQGALTCRSSTLAILADSDPLLLLTVLGYQSDFHDERTLGCVYVSVINTCSFSQFWPVSWTITHCFGVP